MKPLADRFDHIVLTVNDIDKTVKFYERVLGFEKEVFPGSDGKPRYAMRFGNNKINLQDRATDVVNKAQAPTFGSGDFCLVAAVPLNEVLARMRSENIAIEAGPVTRRGAVGPMHSVYFRDLTAISSNCRSTSAVQRTMSPAAIGMHTEAQMRPRVVSRYFGVRQLLFVLSAAV